MAVDVSFTDGTIAAKERYLLGDKLPRMCELGAEEAFRVLKESGFGGGCAADVSEYEKLVAADGRDIDEFVREYAPTNAVREYLLSPRDFHNAKALVKAEYLKRDASPMLAPEGLIPVEQIKRAIEERDFSGFCPELKGACEDAVAYLSSEGVKEGAELGIIFERAAFSYFSRVCASDKTLKEMCAVRADLVNLLTCFRSRSAEEAEKQWVGGGTLGKEKLSSLFKEEFNDEFEGSVYQRLIKSLSAAKAANAPMTDAENYKDSFDLSYLAERKYELKGAQTFLYYVLRRRAENSNVRIVFACLLNGVKEREIKARLRGERALL